MNRKTIKTEKYLDISLATLKTFDCGGIPIFFEAPWEKHIGSNYREGLKIEGKITMFDKWTWGELGFVRILLNFENSRVREIGILLYFLSYYLKEKFSCPMSRQVLCPQINRES